MKIKLAALASALCGTVLWTGPAAQADVWVHSDPVADMNGINDDNYIPGDPWSKNPHQAEGDIRSVRVNHLPRKTLVSLTFQQFSLTTSPTSPQYFLTYRLRTADAYRSVVVTPHAAPAGQVVIRNRAGNKVVCGATYGSFATAKTVVLRLPRACFGPSRAWVRVAAGATVITDGVYRDRDDANRHFWPTGSTVLGPRVHL